MDDSGLEMKLFTLFFLGMGGVALGLIGLVFRLLFPRRHQSILKPAFAVLLGLAAVTWAMGQPQAIWVPPLGLAGVCGLFGGIRSPWTGRVGVWMLSLAAHPQAPWASLLAGGLVLTLWGTSQ